MTVIDTLEAMPNRIRMLAEVVGSQGTTAREELARRIVPGAERHEQFNNLLREGSKLGFIEQIKESKLFQLNSQVTLKQIKNIEQYKAICLAALVSEGGHGDNKDFARALGWFLTRPIGPNLESGGEFQVELLKDLEGAEIYDLTNASRCSMLMYWMHFLGFAEWLSFNGKDYCNPDPTRVMAVTAKGVLEKKHQTPIAEFFKRLGKEVPVFETGHVRAEIESRLKAARDVNYISKSSSLALARLKFKGDLAIERLADAPAMLMVDLEGREHPVSHITLL